jgi:ribosomal subunit interface protein
MVNIKLNIKATNYDLKEEIRSDIDNQVKQFEKFLPNNTEEVILDVEVGKTTKHHNQGLVYRAEFNMKYSDVFLRSESVQEDIRAAIELAGDELVRQIKKNKSKRRDLIRRGAGKVKRFLKFNK